MAKKIGTCLYCLQENVELQNSHIIPEFCYKRVYTSKHNLKAFSIDEATSLKMEQKGYREYLFCSKCEGKLSVWEKALSELMEEVISGDQKKITIKKFKDYEIINDFNYDFIKRALLSILWRLSISNLTAFNGYSLGPYKEKLKILIDSPDPIKYSDYPIIIYKGILQGKFEPAILKCHKRGRYGTNSMQTITINGFIIDIVLSDSPRPSKELKLFCLKEKDTFIISRNLETWDIDLPAVCFRMGLTDVTNFYQSYN